MMKSSLRSGSLSWQEKTLQEAVRLRETLWGPMEDLSESRRAQAAGGSFSQRLRLRAQLLAQREGWPKYWHQWVSALGGVALLLALLAILAGVSVAMGALGDGTRPVNLLMALLALLGLHTLTLAFWLLGLLWPRAKAPRHTWLGSLCLYLGGKWVRGPDAMLIPQAFTAVVARLRGQVFLFGIFSHAWWLLALLSAFCTLVALLTARSYQFNWETTLLTPEHFVYLTQWLGALPRWLGFAMPAPELIRLSDGEHVLDARTQALWSSWLLGAVLIYGLIPRLLALVLCLWRWRGLSLQDSLDESLPGWANLRSRLMPTAQVLHPDQQGPDHTAHWTAQTATSGYTQEAWAAGLEWSDPQAWPPAGMPPWVGDLGTADSRPERLRILASLQAKAPARLVLLCNADLTPDRGSIATLVEWAQLAERTDLLLLSERAQVVSEQRRRSWRERLLQAGFSAEQIYDDWHALDKESDHD